ncbi:MAG: iron ABC transporter permease [Calditrichota bacterium]
MPSLKLQFSKWTLNGFLGILLLYLMVLATGVGAVHIPASDVLSIILHNIGLSASSSFTELHESIVLNLRLPRVMLATLVGATLAVSGAALQGLFRNPLAEPGLIGVSSGAAIGVCAGILTEPYWQSWGSEILLSVLLPLFAFVGAIVAVYVVYAIANRSAAPSVATMLLCGIAITALAQAGIGFFSFISTEAQLRNMNMWLFGSLAGASWDILAIIAPIAIISVVVILFQYRPLNALLLGERQAGHLGVNVDRFKRVLFISVAAGVGACVSISGIIGFVGLIVPHLLRLTIGSDHRYLLTGSALMGGVLLLGADILARITVTPAELPVGIVTAMVGVPFFLWLIVRNHSY